MLPLLPVLMDVAQQGYVQARVEERVRTGNDVVAEETELNPQLRYDLIWQGGLDHFVVSYQPRLVLTHTFSRNLPDPNLVNPDTINTSDPNDRSLSALHNATIGLEVVRPRWRLSAYQFGAYGPVTTTTLLVQAPWTGDGPPADPVALVPSTIVARFTLLFAQTQLFVPIRVSKRVAVTPSFVYNAFGGADSESRAAMALTFGPGVALDVEVAATKADRFTSHAGAGQISTNFEGDRTGASIYRAEAWESWRHWYSSRMSTEVIGGGSVGGDNINGTEAYSIASAGLLYDSYPMLQLEPGAAPQGAPPGHGDRVQLGLLVKAAPWLDLFSGGLEERAVGVAAMNFTRNKTTLRGQLSGGRVFDTPETVARYTILEAEASTRYAVTPTFAADLGVRFGYQDFNNAIRFNTFTQATFYCGITWTPLPARF